MRVYVCARNKLGSKGCQSLTELDQPAIIVSESKHGREHRRPGLRRQAHTHAHTCRPQRSRHFSHLHTRRVSDLLPCQQSFLPIPNFLEINR